MRNKHASSIHKNIVNQILLYAFKYEHIIPKWVKKGKSNYMDTESYYIVVETDDIYQEIIRDVEKRFDTWNYYERRRKKNIICRKKIQKGD